MSDDDPVKIDAFARMGFFDFLEVWQSKRIEAEKYLAELKKQNAARAGARKR